LIHHRQIIQAAAVLVLQGASLIDYSAFFELIAGYAEKEKRGFADRARLLQTGDDRDAMAARGRNTLHDMINTQSRFFLSFFFSFTDFTISIRNRTRDL
jgi:hypothetical protein